MSTTPSQSSAESRARHYTVADLCAEFGTSKVRVLAWIAAGELAAINIGSPGCKRPTWRITQDALDAFIAARSTQPPAPKPARRQRKYVPQILTDFR